MSRFKNQINRRCGNVREHAAKLANPHQAAFVAAIVALGVDLILSLAALYVYKFQHSAFSLFHLPGSEEDQTTIEMAVISGLPIIATLFAFVLCFGNRMGTSITYFLFLVVHGLLIVWNLSIVVIIYAKTLPTIRAATENDEETPDMPTAAQLHEYAAALLLLSVLLIAVCILVFRGWRYLRFHSI
ncbi:hypothetical protein M3Y99_01755700 [Aphelenchoides fujianensis]|nr:hypothetical protein M3Y99_01755700 [Aphelenchoides fujianensis]